MYIVVYGIGLLVEFIFIVLTMFGKGGMFAMFSLLGGVIGFVFTGQLATDTTLTVSYNAGTPITIPAYPPILISSLLALLCLGMVVWKAADIKRSGASINGAQLALKIMLLAILVAVAAYLMPGAYNTIQAADLGDSGLTALMGNLAAVMTVAAYFSFAYISFVSRD